MNVLTTLQQYWGYSGFRPMQEEIIQSVLAGRDVFAMLPTGAGKSLCYQVPAMNMEGITIVVSPLIALIEDQVQALNKRNIPAVSIHSGLDRLLLAQLMDEVADGRYKLVYVAPERLQSETFRELMIQLPVQFIAVDEAHCISQWGHDFRPAYRNIAEFRELFPKVPVLAITASATAAVQEDICKQLKLHQPQTFTQSVIRPNLSYHIDYTENKPVALTEALVTAGGSSIVYCKTRKRTVDCMQMVKDRTALPAYHYHAGMRKMEKDFAYHQWLEKTDAVMTATTAFGMGIDKPDVRLVLHYDLPTSIEQYYQEVGRAGRDGAVARGQLFYHTTDINYLLDLPEIQFPPISQVKAVYQHLSDYLGIHLHTGNEQVFAFDITEFVTRFKLDMVTTVSSIKILEREGFMEWNENAQTQYTIRFTTDRDTINYLEKNYKTLYPVVETLLRHYGSIYNFETAVPIFKVAKALNIDKSILEDRLWQLQDLGVLEYKPAIVGSYMLWLHNRIPFPYLNLNEPAIRKMKAALSRQVQEMADFIQNEETCRNRLLSAYFGQEDVADCGQCDNCQKHRSEEVHTNASINNTLIEVLKREAPLPLSDLLQQLRHIHREQVIQALRALVADGKVRHEGGIISF
jgi:ATP-dependent DNA helicase RecQ